MTPHEITAQGFTRRSFMKTSAFTVGTAIFLSGGTALADNYECTTAKVLSGTDDYELDFGILKQGIIDDWESTVSFFQDVAVNAGAVNDWIDENVPLPFSPTGVIQNLWNWVNGEDTQPTDLIPEELKDQIEGWLNETVKNALTEYINDTIASAVEKKYTKTFHGSAYQNGRTAGAPMITGPGTIVNATIGLDLEVDGIGLKGTYQLIKTVSVTPPGPDTPVGFDAPGGPLTKAVPCEDASAVVGDLAHLKAEIKFDFTIVAIPIKFELEDTRVHPNAILVTVS